MADENVLVGQTYKLGDLCLDIMKESKAVPESLPLRQNSKRYSVIVEWLIIEVTNSIPCSYRRRSYRWFNLGKNNRHITIFFFCLGDWHINFRTPSLTD